MQVELGEGIVISRKIYKEIFGFDHVRKFTKGLAVAVWGSDVLAERSVTGKPCRNRNGPKKLDQSSVAVQKPTTTKPSLTPEKLAVITGNPVDLIPCIILKNNFLSLFSPTVIVK